MMNYLNNMAIIVVIKLTFTLSLEHSEPQFLSLVVNGPDTPIVNNPCALKIESKGFQCLYDKISRLNPGDINTKYLCCLSWVASECYHDLGQVSLY